MIRIIVRSLTSKDFQEEEEAERDLNPQLSDPHSEDLTATPRRLLVPSPWPSDLTFRVSGCADVSPRATSITYSQHEAIVTNNNHILGTRSFYCQCAVLVNTRLSVCTCVNWYICSDRFAPRFCNAGRVVYRASG